MDEHTDRETEQMHANTRTRQRERVLELVRDYDAPVDATELAERTGLHVTTVRFHLDALCSTGDIERTRITRAGVGRPRTGYLAVRERLDYRGLAEILALELGDTTDKRRRRAEAAGRRWAERIAVGSAREFDARSNVSDGDRQGKRLESQAAMIATVFERMGFGPELTPAATSAAGTQQTIRLRACPVRELARAHPEVGCALHLGLLQGLLTNPASDSHTIASRPVTQAELEPFVEPDLCLARVFARD